MGRESPVSPRSVCMPVGAGAPTSVPRRGDKTNILNSKLEPFNYHVMFFNVLKTTQTNSSKILQKMSKYCETIKNDFVMLQKNMQ